MSLPTPPSTSHRDKENRLPTSSRISWSQHNEYHCLATSPPPKQPPKPSGSRSPPTKSILKKSTYVLLPFADIKETEECKLQREVTPEPADPLTNLSYLTSSVEEIVGSDNSSSLKGLIQAYSVLTARLKAAVNGTTDADASWPLFQPLRRHRDAVVHAFIRDLGRALVDSGTADQECEEERVLLPSPQSSPKRKKGMSAEQVKYARDLCTTCHAVMKLLAVVLTLPAIYRVFTDEQLCAILTQVLAIPISEDLPTPNSRKTCALSIWLIQSQRLPSEVLLPAKDRIAYALRRGIEGELGKEGKKGSANDGLKAIHELSTYQPTTFLPAFANLLPSILSNLLAPTLALRTQACHALGGLVLALTSLSSSPTTLVLHARISASIAEFLKSPITPSKTHQSSPSRDPAIVRTIRTTLQATEPQQAAQGPVWALTVLANFTVLLGSRLYTDAKLCRIMTALLSLSMRHKKSSVRGLGCLVWRCVAWAWFQRPFPKDKDEENEMVVDEGDGEKKQSIRDTYWRVVKSVVDIGSGVATIAALLNDDSGSSADDEDDNLRRVMQVMRCMIKKGGQTCGDAMEILKIFVSSTPSSPSPPSSEWNTNKLLPPSLFNALPGLLSAEYKSLVSAVRPIFEQCPQLEDVRPLAREVLAKEWVFDELVDIWRKGLCYLELPEECGTPPEVVAVWDGLLTANVSMLQDPLHDDAATTQFAIRTTDILIDILQDTTLDLTTKSGPPRKALSSSSPTRVPPSLHSNIALKLSITRDLWTVVRTTIPLDLVAAAGEKLLACLVDNEDDWVWETDPNDDARKQWAMFCAEILLACHSDELKLFWGTSREVGNGRKGAWSRKPTVRHLVWACFVHKWKEEGDWNWEGAAILLGVPFVDTDAWDLDNDDFEVWDEFLGFAMNKALDYGVDSSTVLDQVACTLSQNPTPAFADSARIADLLLTHLEIGEARQIPGGLFDFANDTLLSTYPPEPRNKVTSSWLLRSLTRAIDACPAELALNLFETIQDGLSLWISDSYEVFTDREYEDEIVPMYQTVLFGIQLLPRTVKTLETVSAILESAFCGRKSKPASLPEAFTNFWNTNWSSLEEPASGWPEKIQTCLVGALADNVSMIDPILLAEDAAAACDADVPMEQDDVTSSPNSDELTDYEDALLFPESEDERETPISQIPISKPNQSELAESSTSSDLSGLVGQLGPAFCTHSVTASQSVFVPSDRNEFIRPGFSPPRPPSTPAKAPLLTSTPPRRKKFSALMLPPRSPATPLPSSQRVTTPKRTPPSFALASHSLSSNRRLVDDKENMSPHPVIASFTERLARRSPAWSMKDTPLGKRRAVDGWQEGSALKKVKADTGELLPSPQPITVFGSDDSEHERLVERSLVHDASSQPLPASVPLDDPFTAEPENLTSAMSSRYSGERKRKRVFMDAVEVPTLREILIRERKATPDKRVLRRSRSATTRSFGLSFIQPSVFKSLEKKSSTKASKQYSSDDLFLTSPSSFGEDINSDDSIIWVKRPQTQAPPELSSDDDPHPGQVTPHHLISPVPRRVQYLTSDPPSDDSNISASPSHELATRRKQRLTSFSYLR